MKVVSVVGARPQFIKAFVVSRELRRAHEEVLVHTGQHYDEEMSDVFFDDLGLEEPAYNLGVGSDSHGRQTARMLAGIERVIQTERPDVVVLYGDTNSTLAGAIAGSKLEPVVAHVEAGLRSDNREMPEEINRVLTDHAADLCFPPSAAAAERLRAEGITEGVHVVGDVMYDSIQWARDAAISRSTILNRLNLEEESFVLATVHRAANTDDSERLESILDGLSNTARNVVFPVHPRTEKCLRKYGLYERAESALELTAPVGYLDFVRLLDAAERVATDSGGVQKEAFFLDTPCVTLREETEWVETVECGWNTLVGADSERITHALNAERSLGHKPTPYGDGNAAERIVSALETHIDRSLETLEDAR